MSDFDKEAEREKLRKKYERDKAEREATQRMSDLLLKGATMTNSHCGTCGDPLFQENGTTFCPSCHGNPDAVDGTDLEAQPADDAEASAAPAQHRESDRQQSTPSDDDRQPSSADSSDESDAATHDAQQHSTEPEPATSEPATSEPTDREQTGAASTRDDSRQPSSTSRSSERTPAQSAPSTASPSGDLESAHDSLVQALEKWADEAARADDPRYAKDCLEAAREASEALEALQ
ncbi:Sjogren's syndrome/scleroderma autoantigen 1 family protein [Natronolimnobius baerhuensis]|uniref:Uncharacterized protein n=1 Tax=Natronolimnobius baerhuensis TaxID=253108 RepID=A0A202E588_9EURY|nr:Sjogren's syndrome/scleroderma autoantigen 1 family protein [Natronolimnobius baerhuensis]OVE83463.1 hypothetical protein B2G88_13525 [Natronolimnobius baerhuensis]